MLIKRSDRGLMANWWFTVDWMLMTSVLVMMAAGIIFSLAASPPVAERLQLDSFHFFHRHVVFMIVAIVVMIATSLLERRQVWRLCLAIFFVGLALMGAAFVIGPEIKGAHRWIDFGPFNLQPSEIVKPAFVVVAAWLISEDIRRDGFPGRLIAWAFFAGFIGLLFLQPDFGQTVLVCLVWGVMLLVSGIPWTIVASLGVISVAGAIAAYQTLPHVASRVERFINPQAGDNFQVDTATKAFENGGLFGTGPGYGKAKLSLPDAHTDFTYSAIGEEFGFIACLFLLLLVCFVVFRVLGRAQSIGDPFKVLAMTGLVSIFGFQAIINMAVNVSLLPAKGMTLPFISYGGSSMIASALGIGLILALGRRVSSGSIMSRQTGLMPV